MPLVCDMTLEKFDFLMVDEAQDMNKSQTDFILKSISETGRIIAVGDRRQSLYGFRGADTEAIPNIIKTLDATVLPLSVTYRCPKSHVELARQIVTQLEARENAPEGYIGDVQYLDLTKKLQAGDMVICRTNAPLVKPAFECIRMGKKAIIRGKDIGQSLINMIKRFETDDLGEFEVALYEYFHFEHTKLLDKGKELQAMMLEDRVSTLHFIMGECTTVSDLVGKVEMLFNDNNIGIVFSSVHRAKGMEAENVFILRPDLMPHPKAGIGKDKKPDPKKQWELVQESNAEYVAKTRSQNNLFFIRGGENV
jgi:DNA helicase-2/ATP-dependent DNA helicase PcrA